MPNPNGNRNPQTAIARAAFAVAFLPPTPPASLPAWSAAASAAIDALILLRSLVHKWQAAGHVDDGELAAAYEALAAAGLSEWLDGLLGGGNANSR